MNVRMISGLALAFASLAVQSSLSCDEAERIYDCAHMCDAYADCIDDSIDRADCTTTCEGRGEDDSDFAERAHECEVCIDTESCTEAAIHCGTTCAVIPEST